MFKEMTGINWETVHKILDEDLKKKMSARSVPHLLMQDHKHRRTASSVEFVEMTDDNRNVLKRTVNRWWQLVFQVWSRNEMAEFNFVESNDTESSESENAKIAGENNADCIFYAI